jgi:hypothetical protein
MAVAPKKLDFGQGYKPPYKYSREGQPRIDLHYCTIPLTIIYPL